MANLWLEAVPEIRESSVKNPAICCLHFCDDDYVGKNKVFLKPGAVPRLNQEKKRFCANERHKKLLKRIESAKKEIAKLKASIHSHRVSLAKSVQQTSDLKQIQAIISAGEVKISEAQLRNLTEKEREYFDTDEYQIAANLKKLTTFSCYDFIDQNLMPMPDHSKIPGEFKEETTVQFVQLNQPVTIIAEDDIEFVLINNA